MIEETPEQLMARYDSKARWWVVTSALWAGELSEGQAATLLGASRVDLRECVEEYQIIAKELWRRYRSDSTTVDDDMEAEVRQSMHSTPRHDSD